MPRTPAWPAIEARLSSELGGSVRCSGTLGRRRRARATWAARAAGLGDLVVKARHGDRADKKTNWCADNLPRLAARGYPVPEILWHGFVDGGWHIVVQRRLPGRPLRSLEPPLLDAVLALVELQADADVESTERDFAAYQAYVLFDGWDHVWRDAEAASSAAALPLELPGHQPHRRTRAPWRTHRSRRRGRHRRARLGQARRSVAARRQSPRTIQQIAFVASTDSATPLILSSCLRRSVGRR
jgi:hypothetical protein